MYVLMYAEINTHIERQPFQNYRMPATAELGVRIPTFPLIMLSPVATPTEKEESTAARLSGYYTNVLLHKIKTDRSQACNRTPSPVVEALCQVRQVVIREPAIF